MLKYSSKLVRILLYKLAGREGNAHLGKSNQIKYSAEFPLLLLFPVLENPHVHSLFNKALFLSVVSAWEKINVFLPRCQPVLLSMLLRQQLLDETNG